MKLSVQLQHITKSMEQNKPLDKLIAELEKANANYEAPVLNPLAQFVVNVNQQLNSRGIFPLKFNASYFSQNANPENRMLELSWQRNDLIIHKSLTPLKVPKSHGFGFRVAIFGDGLIQVGLSNRYSASGVSALKNFSKNVIDDDGYLSECFDKIIKTYYFELDWFDESFDADNFSELKEYVKINSAKAVNTFVRIAKPVSNRSVKSVDGLSNLVVKRFIELAPFFYSFMFNLEPKKSKTHSSMKGQLTREQLRNLLLKSENCCQNEGCPVPRKHQVLEMAHLVPGIHQLSNVIALCSTCHDKQRPRNSILKLNGLLPHKGNKLIYGLSVSTLSGIEKWRLISKHPLKSFKK